MSAIGILGGMGPQASNKLYELLIKGTQNYTPAAVDDDYPEIVLLNVPVPNFISNKSELPNARQMLIERTKLLEQAGCIVKLMVLLAIRRTSYCLNCRRQQMCRSWPYLH